MTRSLRCLAAAVIGALGAAAFLTPALNTGFLADDFIVIRRCADFSDGAPGLAERLRRGVGNEWSSGFQGYRPLTTGSIQIDHARSGLDAAAYKRTNLALWLAAAAMFAWAASALLTKLSPARTAAAALLFGLWPPAIEPLCWMVIRQESLLCLGAFAAAWCVASRGAGPWVASLGVAFALGAKETGATLPFALCALDAALCRREGAGWVQALRTATLRRSGDLLVLGVWWNLRSSVLGGAGTSWNGEDYFALLTSAEGVGRLGRGVASVARALAAPLAESAAPELPLPANLVLGTAAVASAVFIAAAAWRRRPGDFLSTIGWIAPPLLLLAPGYTVGRDLESVRVAILPGAAAIFAIFAGMNVLFDRSRILAILLFAALLGANILLLHAGMTGYLAASTRVDRLLSDTAEWPESTAIVMHSRDDRTGVFVTDLILHRGAYVLSSAWPTALRPPFRAAPLTVEALGPADESTIAARIDADAVAPRVAALVYDASGPRIVTLAPGGGDRGVVLEPANGATLSRGAAPLFVARFPASSIESTDMLRIVFRLPHGGEFVGDLPATLAATTPDGGRKAIFTPEKMGLRADTLLAAAGDSSMIVWHVRAERDGHEFLRSCPAVLRLH